jgi:hypothetical protein
LAKAKGKHLSYWRAGDDSFEESGQAVEMADDGRRDEVAASEAGEGGTGISAFETQRMSRRQAIGRLSAFAAAGAAAWVTPEILTAKPASGAVLSGTTNPSTFNPSTLPATTASASSSGPSGNTATSLAFTGFELQRDTEIAVALLAGGWAMHHWASRPLRAAAKGVAGSPPGAATGTPTE